LLLVDMNKKAYICFSTKATDRSGVSKVRRLSGMVSNSPMGLARLGLTRE